MRKTSRRAIRPSPRGGPLHAATAVVVRELVAVDAADTRRSRRLQHLRRTPHRGRVLRVRPAPPEWGDLNRQPLNARQARLPASSRESVLLLSEALNGTVAQSPRRSGAGSRGTRKRKTRPRSARLGLMAKRAQSAARGVVGGYGRARHARHAVMWVTRGRTLRFAVRPRRLHPLVPRESRAALNPLPISLSISDLPTPDDRWGAAHRRADGRDAVVTPSLVTQIRFVEWPVKAPAPRRPGTCASGNTPSKDVRREEIEPICVALFLSIT